MGFKIFKSSDGGAPVLSGTTGSLINLLRKCLVDGYGTKTPATGWTLEYINGTLDIAAFRNSPTLGSGCYLRIDEQTATYAYQAKIDGYETMTGISSGSGNFSTTTPYCTFNKSTAANTTGRTWYLFVSPTFIHLVVFFGTTANTLPLTTTLNTVLTVLSFGDFIQHHAQSNPSIIANILSNIGGLLQGFVALSANLQNASSPRNHLSAPNTPTAIKNIAAGPVSLSGNAVVGPPYNGLLALAKFLLHDTSGIDAYRGVVPGCYCPCHSIGPFVQGEEITIGSKTYVIFYWTWWSSTAYTRAIAFEYDEL